MQKVKIDRLCFGYDRLYFGAERLSYGQVGSADLCRSLLAVAGARQRLASTVMYEAPDKTFGGNLDAPSLAEAAEHATDLLRRQPQCSGLKSGL